MFMRGQTIKELECPWCGKHPQFYMDDNVPSPYEDYRISVRDYRFWATIRCPCRATLGKQVQVYGDHNRYELETEFRKQCIEAWRNKQISIPLSVNFPKNHTIISKIPLPKEHSYSVQEYETVFYVSRDRGIFKHLMEGIKCLTDNDGKILSYIFKMYVPTALGSDSYWDCVLKKIDPIKGLITIRHADRFSHNLGTNKADRKWLTENVSNENEAPIHDFILEKLKKKPEPQEEEY